MAGEESHYPHALKDPTRTVALADGVFAIIMTLLVLELKVPKAEQITSGNMAVIYDCLYTLFLYSISFLLAGVYWIGHRMIFSMVKNVNNTLTWINLIYLMICSLIPFGAALLGSSSYNPYALAGYGMLLFMLAGWRLVMYLYVTSNKDLVFSRVPAARRKRVIMVMIFAPAMFLLSLLICKDYPNAALVLYAITPPMFVTLISIVNKQRKTD